MASIMERESSFCDKDQNDVIVRALYEQKQSTTFCDVVMKVCGREIYAHSNILAAASPYFSQFLGQDLPRTFSQRGPQVIEIQIDGSEPNLLYEEAVASVIDFIYTGRMTVREGNAAQITEIARIMQLDNIVKFCEDFIAGKTPSATTVVSGTQFLCCDANVNTDKSFDVNQRVQLVDFITSVTEPTIIQTTSKVKPSKMLSIATQVMPQLLGLRPEVAQTREVSTSTDRRLFEALGASGRGRKTSYLRNQSGGRKPVEKKAPGVEEPEDKTDNTEGEPESEMEPVEESSEEPAQPELRKTPPRAATSARYKKLISELTAEPELKGTFRRRSSAGLTPQKSTDTTEEKTSENKDTSDEIASPKGIKVYGRKLPPVVKQEQASVGLTTRSGRRIIKQEIPDDAGSGDSDMDSEDANLEEGEISLHAVLLDALGKKDKEEGEIDYNAAEADAGADNSLNESNFNESTEDDGVPRRPTRKRGRPKKNDDFETYFVDSTLPKKYVCGTCDFQTNKVREMSSHNKLHKLEQNTCFYCEEKFDDHEVLTQHMEKHKGPNPFFCSTCDSRFKTRTQLNLHLPKHSDEKPFICEICSQGFKWKHALKSHMITHSNKKDHLCAICGYATAHKSQLKAHNLIHTGQTYKCEFPGCPFQATKLQNMKYHILTHTREKPHQCDVCGQSFSLVKNMRRHMLLHSADKSYKCNECDFASTRYDKLKEHQLKLHGFGTPPEKRVKISDMVEANKQQVTMAGRQVMPTLNPTKTEVEADPTITILNPPTVEIPVQRDISLTNEEKLQLLQNQAIIISAGDVTREITAENLAEVAASLPADNSGVIQGQGMTLVEGTLVQGTGEDHYPVQYTEVMIPASQVDMESLVQTVYVTAQPGTSGVTIEEQDQ